MAARSALRLGGIEPLTTIDFAGKLATVLFLQGCPWRCRYCHNPRLLPATSAHQRPWSEALEFLRSRQGIVDGVVFSGGEPTWQDGLPVALREVADLGFAIALHTNGSDPELLATILEQGLVAQVAMDLKAPFALYERITRVPGSGELAGQSARAIIQSGIAHEFRTTWHPALLTPEDVLQMGHWLSEQGAQAYYLQCFRTEGCPDAELREAPGAGTPPADAVLAELKALLPQFGVRGGDGEPQ